MPWEKGLKLCDAVDISLLDTAEPSPVEITPIGGVTIALSHNAGINAGRVTMPHLKVNIRDRLAGVDVNDLVVNQGGYTFLIFHQVATNPLSADIIGALGNFRSQDTRAIAVEESAGVGVQSVSLRGSIVVGSEDGVEVALRDAPYGARFMESSLTTGNIAVADTTSLQFDGAVTKVRPFDGAEELFALSNLFSKIMTRMGRHGG